MKQVKQRVSVIIPVYNGARYLSAAIESVLAQTYQSIEINVVDDGSTDNSASIAQRYALQVRYFYQTNQGQAVAFNHGIDMATGNFLAFLDADDLWNPEKISWQLAVFDRNPNVEAVFGYIQQFYSPDVEPQNSLNTHYARETMPGYSTNTLLIQAKAFHRIGYFRPEQRIGAFIEWFGRAQEQDLRTEIITRILAQRRIHATNQGLQERARYGTAYTDILKAALDRRRANETQDG